MKVSYTWSATNTPPIGTVALVIPLAKVIRSGLTPNN